MACDTSSHELCAGGDNANPSTDGRPRMQTDSEALLHAGVQLAERAWGKTRRNLDWQNDEVDRVFTHQVGRAHRRLMLDRLGLPADRDFPTVEFLGNTGAAALPTAWSLGIQAGALTPGHRVALLGIGSGLNSMMLGVEWQAGTA